MSGVQAETGTVHVYAIVVNTFRALAAADMFKNL
jgi:hypothetical protein